MILSLKPAWNLNPRNLHSIMLVLSRLPLLQRKTTLNRKKDLTYLSRANQRTYPLLRKLYGLMPKMTSFRKKVLTSVNRPHSTT